MTGCLQQGTPLVADRSPSAAPKPKQAPVVREVPAAKPKSRVPIEEGGQSSRIVNAPPKKSTTKPSVRTSSTHYIVRRGDTLYSIAWRYNLDPEGFAHANGIRMPFTIFPGQRLKLVAVAPPKRVIEKPIQAPRVEPSFTLGGWRWPMNRAPSAGYTRARKGVDFELPPGSRGEVNASNAGKVVYAGNGIGGYEQLIIIKHSDSLLSAYSFNGANRVAEQATVKVGQKIADILPVGRTTPKLHFEIRKDGDPGNPRTYIKGRS